jgi:hypothetical protein
MLAVICGLARILDAHARALTCLTVHWTQSAKERATASRTVDLLHLLVSRISVEFAVR